MNHTTVYPIRLVSILGCGWLGLPLGKALADKGYGVKGSTTSPTKLALLAKDGIRPFLIDFRPTPSPDDYPGNDLEDFLTADLLVINLPPKVEARGEDFHVRQIQHLCRLLPTTPVRHLLYVSSTSVYPDLNREVDESEVLPREGSNLTLLRAENLLRSLEPAMGVTILRCGGLMGYDRMPGKYVAGRKGLTTGEVPVNYVHRDDVIAIILETIRQPDGGRLFNVVAPLHPTRREVYLQNTAQFGLLPPEFSDTPGQPFKLVSSEKLRQTLPYEFLYPDPLHFYYSR